MIYWYTYCNILYLAVRDSIVLTVNSVDLVRKGQTDSFNAFRLLSETAVFLTGTSVGSIREVDAVCLFSIARFRFALPSEIKFSAENQFFVIEVRSSSMVWCLKSSV